MDGVDVVIIGAGVVGLAAAAHLSRRFKDVVVLEKEPSFGQHGSSRNSEVIHSGIYYPAGSLKASLCLKGNPMIYRYLEEKKIGVRRCGKLIVATSEPEIKLLEDLMEKGRQNGVEGLVMLSREETRQREPSVRCHQALWVPSTGIMDSHGLMKNLLQEAESNGALVAYNSEVGELNPDRGGYIIGLKGQDFRIEARVVLNCAGLWSDRVAALAGIDLHEAGYRLHWNKGEYYSTSRYRHMPHLIYPLPHSRGQTLGIHTVVNLSGEVSFGPNSIYVNNLDYKVGEENKGCFLDAIRTYMDIDKDDIWPTTAGIRPKLQAPGEEEKDFVIVNEKERGLPNLINLIGIESPGLTVCLAIASYINSLIDI